MLRYGKKSDYGDRVPPDASTKVYQHLFLRDHLPRFVERGSRVLEVGANLEFGPLLALEAAERWVADPYNGVAGGGADHVPEPDPFAVSPDRSTDAYTAGSMPSGPAGGGRSQRPCGRRAKAVGYNPSRSEMEQ